MAQITDLAHNFITDERPVGMVIDEDQVVHQLVAAVRFYAGYAQLKAFDEYAAPLEKITPETDITSSEWAMIRPLFLLYAERENALQLEASRGMGVDVYGRSVSEISSEITQLEADMPYKAFIIPIETVI